MFRFIFLILVITIGGCDGSSSVRSGPAMVSVSSDGKYAISAHYGRFLILWDIKNKTKKILNTTSNIYSPYFIPDTHQFLWQNALTNEVHVQDVNGVILKTFNTGFQAYGHVMSTDLKTYIASANNWSLFKFVNGHMEMFRKSDRTAEGSARLFNIFLTKGYLLTSGDCYFEGEEYPIGVGNTLHKMKPQKPREQLDAYSKGVVLWDARTAKPIKKFVGNVFKTIADLSPDTNYVVSGDENAIFYRWNAHTGVRTRLDEPMNPRFDCGINNECIEELARKKKISPPMPPDFYYSDKRDTGEKNVGVKFISEQGDFIRFVDSAIYGVLYNVATDHVLAYLRLGKDPVPNTYSIFESAVLIDTAPKANILVMGQAYVRSKNHNGTGIIVYHFDPKTKQLERIWAPEGPPSHKRIINALNKWEV